MKLPAYPRYKPSGVEWLGDVPEHWEVKRLKFSSRTIMGQSPSSELYTNDPEERPFLQGNAEFGERFPSAKWFCDDAPKTVPAGALLLSVRAPVGALNEADKPYAIGRGLCAVVDNSKGFEKDYAWYALQLSRTELDTKATGSTYDAVSAADVGNIQLALPSSAEQQSIAAFLDRETGRVDRLVAKKQELIERLKEKRTALISRTVTRGLPPAAARAASLSAHPPLKPSGTEWIGETPKHWVVMKVKFVARMESGHTPSRSDPSNWIDDECVIPWVSLNDTKFLKENDFIGDTAVRISEEGMRNSSAHLLPAGVVVFTRDATIGLTAITTCSAAVSQHIIAWVLGSKITPKYLLLSFKAMQQDLESFTFGSTLKTIGMTDVRKLVTPVPPLPEQAAIAAYLDTETAKLDALVGKVEEAMERLQEYRTALITAVVTGKIDARKAAA